MSRQEMLEKYYTTYTSQQGVHKNYAVTLLKAWGGDGSPRVIKHLVKNNHQVFRMAMRAASARLYCQVVSAYGNAPELQEALAIDGHAALREALLYGRTATVELFRRAYTNPALEAAICHIAHTGYARPALLNPELCNSRFAWAVVRMPEIWAIFGTETARILLSPDVRKECVLTILAPVCHLEPGVREPLIAFYRAHPWLLYA